MIFMKQQPFLLVFAGLVALSIRSGAFANPTPLLEGIPVTPHVQSRELRYRRKADFSLGASVELFLRNPDRTAELQFAPDAAIRMRGRTPAGLLAADEWAWHDFPGAWTDAPARIAGLRGIVTVESRTGRAGLGAVAEAPRALSD